MNKMQRELLIVLAEEAAEVVHACTKALRHGLDSYHPESIHFSNQDNLNREVGQFEAVAALLCHCDVLHSGNINRAHDQKLRTLTTYLHHCYIDDNGVPHPREAE